MIQSIHEGNLDRINNPALRRYARLYVDIYRDFLSQVSQYGLEFEDRPGLAEQSDRLERMQSRGVQVRNDRKSLVYRHISPSCLACRTAEHSETFFISLRCHRNCYFCFNPNQDGYQYFLDHPRDPAKDLAQMAARGRKLEHIALTGGEPLLHPEKCLEFFRQARRLYPEAYTRLYTSGDHLNRDNLSALAEAGLDEIRISIRMHDLEKGHLHTYQRLALSREFIPHVLVEMPVLPDSFDVMVELLSMLEQIGVEGINLLEFCFPMNQAEEFRKRGFKIKTPPFRVLYNYWYAGGLPIAGSEEVCLDLIEYGLEHNLNLGLHYCSLENKHSGQVYLQNCRAPLARTACFSAKDFFIKTAKVFGEDIPDVKRALVKVRRAVFDINEEHGYLEFHPRYITALQPLDLPVALSYNIVETRNGQSYLRELKLDLTTPQEFNFDRDV